MNLTDNKKEIIFENFRLFLKFIKYKNQNIYNEDYEQNHLDNDLNNLYMHGNLQNKFKKEIQQEKVFIQILKKK